MLSVMCILRKKVGTISKTHLPGKHHINPVLSHSTKNAHTYTA